MNNPIAGRTKTVQNYISATYPDGHVETLFTPPAPYETPEALDRICEEYNRVIGNMELEPLLTIPIFIHDFPCIHPFNDGNGRMSRLLPDARLSGAHTAFAKIMAKEYGDAGGLDDLLLVLPEL
ncbi:MAG: Fic family protein [Peptoniphilaceae bacterium]|nr:Fic family protein [Peptoniphilaceae bacterium]